MAPSGGAFAQGLPAMVLRGTLATESQPATGSVGGKRSEGGEAGTSHQLQVREHGLDVREPVWARWDTESLGPEA